ncbi:MAG: prepilin-type N-terminal cleavage/methylation domain-containing protein [Betaproteobacteria bacterium]|nr:prepilin-type N-terminal cleavage/methylation domain-containing protein [Betaproteobacteria bacterium]
MTFNKKLPLLLPGKSQGMTLIELMVVVVVIAILAAVAYPSYQEYIIRANRSAAQQFMLNIANREEQYLLDAKSYTATIGAGGINLIVPSEITSRYTFAVAVPSPDTPAVPLSFKITATAIGPQVSDGDLTLNNEGVKTPAAKWQK